MPDDRVVPVGRAVDLAEATAERDLGFGFEVQAAEDQHAVVLQGVEDGRTDRVIGGQPVGVNAGDFSADGRRSAC